MALEPHVVAALDQTVAGMRDLATVFGEYFRGLLDNGLERGEAILLTSQLQDALCERAGPFAADDE